jgi:uncharacterized protein YecE (DUF72 family)
VPSASAPTARSESREPRRELIIGCAGFPVPATRLFKEIFFVEVPDTHVTQPGAGTIRRWRREAPPGFTFAVQAPRDIGQEGFRPGKIVEGAVKSLVEVAKELDAKIAVFGSPPDFTASRANKAAVKEFLAGMGKRFDHVVWEPPPGWDADDAQALAQDAKATASRDPLVSGVGEGKAKFAYYRLPGPAGHKSRYEDPAIEKLGEIAAGAEHEQAVYVFANVDMFADAKRLKRVLELP